ncbi:MAG: hypothetical protein NVSMB63_08960 [Sediminibacterium sp.]
MRMNNQWIATSLLALGMVTGTIAQTAEKEMPSGDKQSKEENIIIRKKGDGKEKMTVVVDGDNITINGKDIKDFKDDNFEVFRDNRMFSFHPKNRTWIAPHRSMNMLNDEGGNFPHSNRAFLGVLSEKNEKGARISSVTKESAAEKAGLQKDDIITKVGNTKIGNSEDLFKAIGKYKPEDKVNIVYLRNGRENTTTATLGKSSNSENRVFEFNDRDFNFDMPPMPGMGRMEFNFNNKPRLGLEIQDQENGSGVKIIDTVEGSPAVKAGLRKDDVITEIDGKTVKSTDDLKATVKELKEGDSIKITYQRAGKTQTTDIKFPKKLKTVDL